MAFKILTENSVDNTNIDGARAEHFNAGLRDGIVKGAFNEGIFSALASNVISFDTCELRISGHRVIIDEIWTQTFSSSPSVATRYALVGQIVVDSSSNVDFSLFVQNAATQLVKDNLFRTENGAGTYQVEIGRFTLTTLGTITDVVRTLDTITGGSSGMGEHFIVGDITTTMLESGMQANVTAEDIYDANGDYEQTDFSFELPETAGTVVKVDNIEQANLDFTSDPQTQLNNKLDKKTGTSVVYINDEQGNSATLPYSQASNVGDAIVQRKTSGAIAVPLPSENEDAVPKSYVDNISTPIGGIIIWSGSSNAVPTNFLLCDGAEISRTTYAGLFSIIGTAFGAGDGSTTFKLPDLRNRFPVGAGNLYSRGTLGGSKDAVVVSHTHALHNNFTGNRVGTGYGNSGFDRIDSFTNNTNIGEEIVTTSAGVSGTDKNMPPYLGLYYIIRAK